MDPGLGGGTGGRRMRTGLTRLRPGELLSVSDKGLPSLATALVPQPRSNSATAAMRCSPDNDLPSNMKRLSVSQNRTFSPTFEERSVWNGNARAVGSSVRTPSPGVYRPSNGDRCRPGALVPYRPARPRRRSVRRPRLPVRPRQLSATFPYEALQFCCAVAATSLRVEWSAQDH